MPFFGKLPLLVLTRKRGQRITIGNIVITVTHTGRTFTKIGIEVPDEVRITRGELADSFESRDTPSAPRVKARLPRRLKQT